MQYLIKQILDWYQKNKRDLPWRENTNPYYVWISEIMLQQTRIEAVISYFQRFIQHLPTVKDLSLVNDEVLLKLWEGLGYYNRARNLKKAAQLIMEKYKGRFPTSYEELITLPGVGDYTASAIASICYGEKKATVDGNVLRVYTRFYNDPSNISQIATKKKIKEELENFISSKSGDFNQGLMEIGEVLCIPKGIPNCELCPLNKKCLSYKNHNYSLFPKKEKQIEKKIFQYTVFLFDDQGAIAISKRIKEKLLNQLWQFPNIDKFLNQRQVKDFLKEKHVIYKKIKKLGNYTHTFTHQVWKMRGYLIEIEKPIRDNNLVFLPLQKIQEKYAIPTAFQPFLYELQKQKMVDLTDVDNV